MTSAVRNKRVLVTGSSRGIGKTVAIALAKSGFDIVVHYRSDQAQALDTFEQIEAFGVTAKLLQFDISDRDATRIALEADIEENGAYYGVICNAGITRDTAFPAMTADEWDSVIGTNLDGFYNVLHPVVMPMVRNKNGGRIITMSSLSGEIGNRGQVNYSAAKAGLIGATKALSLELAKRKITVNCVAPGIIETDMVNEIELSDKALKDLVPLRRMGKTSEVAATVDFLMSDGAAYITRQVISVNGGMA
ncbi:MAG: 3-oxoacyl-[acyl-carrier protein] reductase [Phenylobacterium sp.]|jgi:3-oxoacyl-[acyl-carrier protein] reductase